MKGMKIWMNVVLILVVAFIALPAWGVDLKPGKYQITTKMTMKGMPGMMPPQTFTQCMTEQDLVPKSSADEGGCEVKDMKTKGDTLTYNMECNQDGRSVMSSGKMTYHGDSFEGTSEVTMGPEAGGMVLSSEISGTRLGDCQ